MSFEEEDLLRQIEARWYSLTKPPGSLGRLETAITRLALQQGRVMPTVDRPALYVFCGDHGVTEEGVSAYPAEVTRQMVLNFVRGGAAINVLCRTNAIRTEIVDAGVAGGPIEGVRSHRIGAGTRNFAREPAMTLAQAEAALAMGRALAEAETADLLAVGEMGIGNTTAASALLCAYTGVDARLATGPGTGLAPERVRHKAAVIERALALHAVPAGDALRVLATYGGFEIAMMAGFLMGAAHRRIPVMIDGFISSAAALAACRLAPETATGLHWSHTSAEPGHAFLLEHMNASPLLDLSLRLGEGTGAALGIVMLRQALALYREMATFEEAAVSGPARGSRIERK